MIVQGKVKGPGSALDPHLGFRRHHAFGGHIKGLLV